MYRNPEIENIQKSLDIFIEGLRTLDYEKISDVFFEEAISCGVKNEKINFVYRDHWKEMADQLLAKGEKLESERADYSIRSVNIINNAASVIIDLTFGSKDKIEERYIDFYHMLKVDGKWRIVNKIFPTDVKK